MGLAERFKDKISEKNIFESSKIEENSTNNSIRFISKPLDLKSESNIVKPIENILSSTEDTSSKFSREDLETEIISKIRKTPYWEEYSIQRQEKMISSYLQIKLQMSNCEISNQERKQFIQNMLTLSNNR
jgi:hypothetical protein